MSTQHRWYCRECKREWVEPKDCYANSYPVSITGNPLNGSNCQVCGSPEIELIKFKPEVPGLDIPRVIPESIFSEVSPDGWSGFPLEKEAEKSESARYPLMQETIESLARIDRLIARRKEQSSIPEFN